MCLEFLCSWCHKEEDGPEHPRQSHHTSNGDTYSARHDPPSKPRSEMPSNGDTYSARHDPPSKPDSGRSSNGTDTLNGDTYSARHDPPSKPDSGRSSNGTDDTYTKRKDENPKTSSMVFNGDKDLKAVHPTVGDGARRNGHMRKDEEEEDDDDDDDEEEEVSKAAQTKNRRY